MGWRCANTKADGSICNLPAVGLQPPPWPICPRCKKKPTWVPEAHPENYNKPILAGPDLRQGGQDRATIVAKRASLRPRINGDPVAMKVQQLIADDDELKNNRKLVSNFQLFLFLHYGAADLAPLLKESESLRDALEHEFGTDEVLDADDLDNPPGVIAQALAQGWGLFLAHWEGLENPQDKIKLISDAFDSPKGYAKTARTLETWHPPQQVDFQELFREWLEEPRNDSIFTGKAIMADEREKFRRIHPQSVADALFDKVGQSRCIRQQIKRWYDTESKIPGRYAYMWGLLLQKIHDALALKRTAADHMTVLQKSCADHVQEMILAFNGLIDPQEIQQFVFVRFSYAYHSRFPK
jgi:hypothetical protein